MFYLLTPQSTVMLEKLTITDLLIKILSFCNTQSAITQFTQVQLSDISFIL
jgi:hypothetical protein